MTLIGLLADTHIPHRLAALPAAMFDRLSGVDLILHAGDVVDVSVLDDLRRIAPTQAVRGNLHLQSPRPHDQSLPWVLDLSLHGHRIILSHGHLSHWNSLWEKVWLLHPNHHAFANQRLMRRLARALPGADVYVFGHSHRSLVARHHGALFINPGAVCPTHGETASVARMRVTPAGVEAEILPL